MGLLRCLFVCVSVCLSYRLVCMWLSSSELLSLSISASLFVSAVVSSLRRSTFSFFLLFLLFFTPELPVPSSAGPPSTRESRPQKPGSSVGMGEVTRWAGMLSCIEHSSFSNDPLLFTITRITTSIRFLSLGYYY